MRLIPRAASWTWFRSIQAFASAIGAAAILGVGIALLYCFTPARPRCASRRVRGRSHPSEDTELAGYRDQTQLPIVPPACRTGLAGRLPTRSIEDRLHQE